MGKTAFALCVARNAAIEGNIPVAIFSLEMSRDALVLRMLCCHAEVSSFKLSQGYADAVATHGKLTQAASVLSKAPIFLDDTGGLDVMELRARARRMKKKHDISAEAWA